MLRFYWFCFNGASGAGLLITIFGFTENLNKWKWIGLEMDVPGHIVYRTFNEAFGYRLRLLLYVFKGSKKVQRIAAVISINLTQTQPSPFQFTLIQNSRKIFYKPVTLTVWSSATKRSTLWLLLSVTSHVIIVLRRICNSWYTIFMCHTYECVGVKLEHTYVYVAELVSLSLSGHRVTHPQQLDNCQNQSMLWVSLALNLTNSHNMIQFWNQIHMKYMHSRRMNLYVFYKSGLFVVYSLFGLTSCVVIKTHPAVPDVVSVTYLMFFLLQHACFWGNLI